MRTTTHKVGNTEWYAHHNSDLSGHIKFTRVNADGVVSLDVPGKLVLRLVADLIRARAIAALENMSYKEILKR